MRRFRNAALIVLALWVAAAVMLWRLPAASVLLFLPANAMAKASKFVSLHQIEGTLWHGGASFTASPVAASLRLSWNCAPAHDALAVDCELGGAASGRLRIEPFSRRIHLEHISSQFALHWVANPNVLASSDNVLITLAQLEVSGARLLLDASIVARGASYRVAANEVELGEVFIDCKPAAENNNSSCTIKNRASAAKLDGVIALFRERITGSVELSSPGSNPQRIAF